MQLSGTTSYYLIPNPDGVSIICRCFNLQQIESDIVLQFVEAIVKAPDGQDDSTAIPGAHAELPQLPQ